MAAPWTRMDRLVSPSVLPLVCVCGVVQVNPPHHPSSLDTPPPLGTVGEFHNLGGGGDKAHHSLEPHNPTQHSSGRGGCATNTTSTHSWEEGRSNIPNWRFVNVSTAQPLFKCTKATRAKRKQIPSLTLGPTSSLAPARTSQHGVGGGGVIAHNARGVCAVFVFRPKPPLPTLDILCSVSCCAYAYAKLCVCVCACVWDHICLCMRDLC